MLKRLLVPLLLFSSVANANPSGLAWNSGAKDGLDCLASGRGRAIDVQHIHMGATGNTWADQVSAAKGWVSSTIKSGPPLTLVSPWLLTSGSKGDFAGCANGAYDGSWQQIAAAYKAAAGTSKVVMIEPGWEAAIGSGSHPWGVDYASQVPSYVACWRHVTSVMRGTFPGAKYVWTNARRFTSAWRVSAMDPGTEDLYGIMAYDTAAWSSEYNSTNSNGDPTGFENWRVYAANRGKSLEASEWGIWTQGDDPTYIGNMFSWFKAHGGSGAGNIYSETLQNNSSHELCPSTTVPNSWAKYKSTWQAG